MRHFDPVPSLSGDRLRNHRCSELATWFVVHIVLATYLRFRLTMFLGAVGLIKQLDASLPIVLFGWCHPSCWSWDKIPWCSLGSSEPKGGLSRFAQTNSMHAAFFRGCPGSHSTYKRRGPVCWLQLGLTVVYLILAFPPWWLRQVSMTLCLALIVAMAGTQLQSFTWL